MNHILTIAEAAERMHVSRQRMHQLIESYALHTQKIQGRLLVMDEDELKKIPLERKNREDAKKAAAKMDSMIATKNQTEAELDATKLAEQVSIHINAACCNGDTVSSIAQRAGVARPTVSALRNGNYTSSPSVDNLVKILKAIGFRLTIQPE